MLIKDIFKEPSMQESMQESIQEFKNIMKELIKKDIDNSKRFRLKIPTKETEVSRIENKS